MTDLRIDPDDARKIAGMHRAAAQDIDSVAGSVPGTVDGGPASAVLLQIMGRIVGDASDLATVNDAGAELMGRIADNYSSTEEQVRTQFSDLTKDLPPRYAK